ncbi:MAG: TonB-dependent receptor [Gammaproteobacteria bacterium]|nr:TonB-dependent receptor [Gammaproteobacteria bacterium]
MNKSKLGNAIAIALGASVITPAQAALEEIVVTATKRAESMQDIPVAVQAINGDAMEQLGVATFDEYIQFLPNVEMQGIGPGQREVYIRGVATEQSPTTVASLQGSSPQVAWYLDEQPVAFGGRNLDVYAADIERVEVLPGPQGTLFGASSQSGTVRMITKKPVQGEFGGKVSAGVAFTTGGDISTRAEATINLPLTENMAFRGTVFNDSQGGWIDNVPLNYGASDLSLIQVVNRNQISSSSTISESATVVRPNNNGLIEEDWNDAVYRGARLGLAWAINDSWDVLLQHTAQELQVDGDFRYNPAINDESSDFLIPATNDDEFGLTSWTVNGRIGALDLVYTGGFLDRDVRNLQDYSNYTWGGGYQAYYLGSPFSYVAGGASTLHDPTKDYEEITSSERFTNEIRISSDPEKRVSFTAGIFVDDVETNSTGAFNYHGAVAAGFDVAVTPGGGGSIQTAFPRAGVGNVNPRGATTIFINDFTRMEDQTAFFGEVKFDINDDISLRVGARSYDLDFQFQGSTGSSFFCKNVDPSTLPGSRPGNGPVAVLRPDGTVGCDGNSFDNHVTQRLINIANTGTVDGSGVANATTGILNVPELDSNGVAKQDDTIIRFSGDWKVSEDVMLFATYSEGFRPQVSNRNAGQAASNQSGIYAGYFVPTIASTDEMKNFELGVKGDFLDGNLRLNATYYDSEITELQTHRFDPANVAFLVFIENIGDADVSGIDADFTWAASDNLTISGAASYVDSEITRLNPELVGVAVPVGSELPFTADFSFNLRGRYDFEWSRFGADGYIQAALTYKGDSVSGISGSAFLVEDTLRKVYGRGSGLEIQAEGGGFGATNQTANATFGVGPDGRFLSGRYVQQSYSLVNVAAGFKRDDALGFEIYINNLFDERAETYIHTQQFLPTVGTNRPRTIGMRMSYEF